MRKLTNLLTFAAFAGLSTLSNLANAIPTCSDETIAGTYAFRVSGEVFTGAGLVYRDGIALTTFSGRHYLTQMDYVVANGVEVPGPVGPDGFHVDETGTYTVNENCTGMAQIDFPTPPGGTSGAVIQLFFVVGDGGRVIHTIVTSLTPPNTKVAVPANIHSDAVRVGGSGDD